MDINNDIKKVIESLNFLIYDIFDKANLDKEDDLNVCLNNFILFATKNEYLANLKAYNATEKNELLVLAIDTIVIAYEKLEEMKNDRNGMNFADLDKMCAFLEMTMIHVKASLNLYKRLNTGTWPID